MGENLDSILDRTRKITDKQEGESRQLGIRSIACQMFRLFQQHQDTRHSLWSRFQRRVVKVPGGALLAVGKRMGNYFPIAYVLVKALYLTNAIGQLQIIRQFLGFQGRLVDFGASLFNTLRQKREWNEDETFFPRQTYCPVPIRHLGNKNNVFTAICALPVNMFNEKIYIFLWFWISMVAMATGLSLLLWLARFMFQACQRDFVRDYLMLSIQTFLNDPTAFRESLKEEERHNKACSACNVGGDDKRLKKFVAKFLRSDGAFLLRMMRSNAGDVVTGEILTELWHLYVEVHDKPTQDGESKHLNNSKPEAIPLLKSDAKRSERNGDPTRLA